MTAPQPDQSNDSRRIVQVRHEGYAAAQYKRELRAKLDHLTVGMRIVRSYETDTDELFEIRRVVEPR